MFCPKCGTKALDGAGFCQKCGAKLISDTPAQPSAEATAYPTQRPGNVLTDVPKRKRSKKLLIIVAIVVAFIAILIAVNADDLAKRGEQARTDEEYIDRQQFAAANLSEVYTNEEEGIFFKYPKAWIPIHADRYSEWFTDVQTPLVVLANENGSTPENNSYILLSKFEAAQEDIEYLLGDDEKFAEVFKSDAGNVPGDDLEISNTSIIELDSVPARIMMATSGDTKFQVYFYAANSNIYRLEFCWQEDSSGDKQKIFDAIMDNYTITANKKGEDESSPDSDDLSYNATSFGLCYRGVPVDNLLGISYEGFISIFGEPDSSLFNGEENTYGDVDVYFDLFSQDTPYLSYIGSPDLSDFTYNGQSIPDNHDELTRLIGREPDENRLYPDTREMIYTWDHLGSKAFLVIHTPLTDESSADASVSVSWWDETSESNPDDGTELTTNGLPDGFAWVEEPTGNTNEYTTTVSGIIKNTSQKTYSYLDIYFNLYDSSGNQIGTAFAVISDLKAGGTWKFEATGFVGGAANFEFSSINGH